MFRALSNWIKAIGYLLTGQIDSARRVLDMNPHVVRAKYDAILREKIGRIQQYKQAVAGVIAQQETKINTEKALNEDMDRLERLKAGALAKARQRVDALPGKTKEEVQKDEEYMKCLAAYNDFSSTAAEKQARIADLEKDLAGYAVRLKEHKIQLLSLARELEQIKSEASETVADMITARQEKEVADALSGISEDGTGADLQRMRQLRQDVKAEARVSKELAGTDAKAQESEFLEYARTSTAGAEFDRLVGLAPDTKQSVAAAPQAEQKTALPE